jgi:hypothetical protein
VIFEEHFHFILLSNLKLKQALAKVRSKILQLDEGRPQLDKLDVELVQQDEQPQLQETRHLSLEEIDPPSHKQTAQRRQQQLPSATNCNSPGTAPYMQTPGKVSSNQVSPSPSLNPANNEEQRGKWSTQCSLS